MTVQLHDSSFVSESAAPRDPSDYRWFQIVRGKVHLDSASKQFDVELTKGEKFGLKATKTATYLVDEDDLSVQFKLSPADVAAVLKNAKGFSGKISGKQVSAGNPEQLAVGKPLNSVMIRKLNEQYGNLSAELRSRLLRNLQASVEGNEPRFSPAQIRKTLRSLNKVALQLKSDGKLRSLSPLLKHYGIGERPTTEVLNAPQPDIEKLDAAGKRIRKNTILRAKQTLKVLSDIVKKRGDLPKRGQYMRREDARMALRVLNANNVPIQKNYQPIIDLLSTAPSSKKAASEENKQPKAKSHPGLDVPQGAVPKQDKSGESAKRVTDKDIVSFLRKLGIKLEKQNDRAVPFIGQVEPKKAAIDSVKNALVNAGWNLDYVREQGATRNAGTNIMRFALPGGQREVYLRHSTSKGKGAISIRNTTKKD